MYISGANAANMEIFELTEGLDALPPNRRLVGLDAEWLFDPATKSRSKVGVDLCAYMYLGACILVCTGVSICACLYARV